MTAGLSNLDNVQANILHGSSHWRHARYVFFTIKEPAAAADFIDNLGRSSRLGRAVKPREDTEVEANINLAFTHRGLEVLHATISDTERFHGRHTLRSPKKIKDDQSDLRSAFEGGMYSAEIDDVWPVLGQRGYEWRHYRSDPKAWWSDDPTKEWKPTRKWPHILVWISATTPRSVGQYLPVRWLVG